MQFIWKRSTEVWFIRNELAAKSVSVAPEHFLRNPVALTLVLREAMFVIIGFISSIKELVKHYSIMGSCVVLHWSSSRNVDQKAGGYGAWCFSWHDTELLVRSWDDSIDPVMLIKRPWACRVWVSKSMRFIWKLPRGPTLAPLIMTETKKPTSRLIKTGTRARENSCLVALNTAVVKLRIFPCSKARERK